MAIAALEISFIVLLVGMLTLAGVIGMLVVVRVVEPRGAKVFVQRLRASRR